jgi:hypothetical protein
MAIYRRKTNDSSNYFSFFNEETMEASTILVKITGLVFLGWTIRSMFKHFKERKLSGQLEQSFIEQILNNILLYLWLLFMTVFSIGMIVNN